MAEYRLSEEGKEYLKYDLPEKNLVEFLNSLPQKTATIGKTGSKVKNLPIALKWALEKGWIIKKGDQLTLLKPPYQTEEEVALKKIDAGMKADEKSLKILLERNLVVKVSETYIKTEKSLEKSGNVIEELTHDMIRTGLWEGK